MFITKRFKYKLLDIKRGQTYINNLQQRITDKKITLPPPITKKSKTKNNPKLKNA